MALYHCTGCYVKSLHTKHCKYLGSDLNLYSIDTHFDVSTTVFDVSTTVFENIVGIGEIARNEQFLLFPQCFLLNQIIVSSFVNIYDIISLFAAELEEPKIGISGKGLHRD